MRKKTNYVIIIEKDIMFESIMDGVLIEKSKSY